MPLLSTLRVVTRLGRPHLPTAPLVLSIGNYGLGLTVDAEGVFPNVRGASAPVVISILADAPQPPANSLAVHLGQGHVLLSWDAPSGQSIQYCEVLVSNLLNGTYTLLRQRFTGTRGIIHGIPMGAMFYFRIRSVSFSGIASATTQVRLGKVQQPTVTMSVRAIKGSILLAGARFPFYDAATKRYIAASPKAEVFVN